MADTSPNPELFLRQHLLIVLIGVVVVAAFFPALDIFLAGDDFEWLESTYGLMDDPFACFEPINHFFRPLVKWTYLGNYLIFGQLGVGYMATNLLIHFANAWMIFVLLRRRLAHPLVATGAATAFALSPLHSEAVLWSAGRPDTVLLLCWLGTLLLLDRWCERPGLGRGLAFTTVALLGIGAKESWIVFPFLVSAYLYLVRKESVSSILIRTGAIWAGWTAYVSVFLIFPAINGETSATHYAEFAVFPALSKVSNTLLVYLGLGWAPISDAMAVGLAGVLAAGAAVWLIRTDNRFGGWSLLWTAATLALVAPFPMSVLRHNYLPLAGFWMLVAAVIDRLQGSAGNTSASNRRKLGMALTTVAVVAVLIVETRLLQREIGDYRVYGDLHSRLCQAYASVEDQIARDKPVVLINRGALRGVELMASSVQGGNKTFFVRRDALWQLVFFPQLADFMGRPFEERLVKGNRSEHAMVKNGCTVLVFTDDGFELRPDLEDQVITAMSAGELPLTIGIYRYERLSARGG